LTSFYHNDVSSSVRFLNGGCDIMIGICDWHVNTPG